MKTIKTRVLAILLAAAMVLSVTPLMDTQKVYADATDLGTLIIDLSNGPQTYPISESPQGVIENPEAAYLFMFIQEIPGYASQDPDDPTRIYMDLDKDQNTDIVVTVVFDQNEQSITGFKAEAARSRSIKKEITLQIPDEMISEISDDIESYYSSVNFVFPEKLSGDQGTGTLDLSAGTVILENNEAVEPMSLYFSALQISVHLGLDLVGFDYNNDTLVTSMDLDKDGIFDFVLSPVFEEDSLKAIQFEKTADTKITGSYTLALPAELIERLNEMDGPYYSAMTFIFSKTKPAPEVKKANTLKVKGKKAFVKFKALNKKSKTFSASKVIKFIKKGQGAKTYKKFKGNKKISISKTGKVTVKKGLKKGKYIVKAKVKAAGNKLFKPSVWKIVTFTIVVR